MKIAMVAILGGALCIAQTTVNGGRVYLGTLKAGGASSSVDFTTAGSTAPVKTGLLGVRPAACTRGQIYFATDATAGQNLSLCTTTGNPGVWSTTAGASGSSAISYCQTAGGNGAAFSCAANPAVSGYTPGLTLAIVPDVNGTGGAMTLNVNSLGAKSIKLVDGTTNLSSNDLTAGKLYLLTYDGAVFRMESAELDASSVTRGTLSDNRLSSNVTMGSRNNTYTGYNDMSVGSWRAPESTAASLPVAATVAGRIYLVTDASTAGSCSAGGGSLQTLCRSNGTAYECIGNCGGGATPGGANGQLQYNNNGVLGGISNITSAQLPISTIIPAGTSTTTQAAFMCLDRTVAFSADLNVAATGANIILGTFPAHFIFTDVWARESTTFGAPSMPTLTVSVGPSGAETALLPAVGLKQASNTVASFGGGYAASDNATDVVAQFIAATSNLNTLTAGTWDVRVCGHLGR